MTRKEQQMTGSMSVAKRTRSQVALREKELRKKNTDARLVALGKHRKLCAEKKNNHVKDENDEEGVKVVSEAEYMRRVSMLENRESSPNADVGFEGNSHDSVQVVAEKWNPFGVPFDNDDVEAIGEHHSDTSVGYQRPPRERDSSESNDDFSDRDVSMTGSDNDTSCEDDGVSDEDYIVDDDEMRDVDTSRESGEQSEHDDIADRGRASVNADNNNNNMEEDRGRESVNAADNNNMEGDRGRESVLDDVVVGDHEYMHWLARKYGTDNKQSEDIVTEILGSETEIFGSETEIFGCETEIFGSETEILGSETEILGCFDGFENAGNGNSCRQTNNKKAEKRGKSEKSCRSENGGGRRSKRTECKNVVVCSTYDKDDEYVKWISSKYRININQNEPPMKRNVKIEPETENDHISENSVSFDSVGIKPNLENDCPWPSELRSAKNGSNKRRGGTPTDNNVVVGDFEVSSFAYSSSSPHFPSYKKGGYGKKGVLSKKSQK